MKKISLLMILAIGILVIQCGCTAQRAQRTGFLSDYSQLKPYSDVSYRNAPSRETISRYSKFIIEPVVVHFHTGSGGNISAQEITDLKNYMHDAIVNAISDRYKIVYRPAPGVARVRIALTDLKKAKVLMNIHPASKLMGQPIRFAWVKTSPRDQTETVI